MKIPTLATGTSTSSTAHARRGRARGFSLIEIMAVIAIIGLVTAATILVYSGNTRDTELDQEAERLEALFLYVREQAELQTRDYGLRITDRNYSFVVYDVIGDQWRVIDEDDALREREFPAGIEPRVVVDGRTIVLDSRKKEIEDFSPHILIFANGDLSSFEVTLRREDSENQARLYTDEDSNIQLLLPGESVQPGPPARTADAR